MIANKKESIDGILYAPIQEEWDVIQEFFPYGDGDSLVEGKNFTGYLTSHLGKHILVVVGLEFGNFAAGEIMREVLQSYEAPLAVCLGIAGGISSDVQLGDVVFNEIVEDLTQRQKITKSKDGKQSTQFDSRELTCDEDLCKILQRWRLRPGDKSEYRIWQETREEKILDRYGAFLGSKDYTELQKPSRDIFSPKAMPGPIASTDAVIASEEAVRDIKNAGRKIACVDNESAGFTRELKRHHPAIRRLVIRGVSDYSDDTKNKVEDDFEDVFRKIAIENAVSFFEANFLAIYEPIEESDQSEFWPEKTKAISELQSALNSNSDEIRSQLYDNSLLHKITDDFHLLPSPRLRFKLDMDLDSEVSASSLEIDSIFSHFDKVVVDVPVNHPDRGLPWQYASAIDRLSPDDKLLVPIVVGDNDFAPPKKSLTNILEKRNLLPLANQDDYKIVFIFPKFKSGLKRHCQFLTDCMEELNNSAVLLFCDDDHDAPYSNHLMELVIPKRGVVEGVSYSSITRFIANSMDLDLTDAEVSAHRLYAAFQGHKLPIHSSYIASVNKDIMTRMINASQRGELVELSVRGILTLLVASDKAKVKVSQTTRETFLKHLAIEIYVNKRNFTDDELLNYIQELEKVKNWGIDPRQFLSDFLNNGIIHFENDRAEITIPIIKSYALSKGLISFPEKAEIYFDPYEDNFDFQTFDLYCEYCESNPLTNKILDAVDVSISFFEDKISKYPNPIIDGRFNPPLFENGTDIKKISEQISADAESIAETTQLVDEKQEIIDDIQNQLSQTQQAQETVITDPDEFKNEFDAVRHFRIAAKLVGTGSEQLDNVDKVNLIKRLLKLADVMTSDIFTLRQNFDSKSAAADTFENFMEEHDVEFQTEKEKEDFKVFIERIIERWDFEQALNPLLFFLHILCESGRSKALLAPLNEADAETNMEEFFRSSWLFDMDPIESKGIPKEISKKLGANKFLRMTYAYFFRGRVYWYHPSEHRQPLISSINEILSQIFRGMPETKPDTEVLTE